MQPPLRRGFSKKLILKIVILFVCSYSVFLVLWTQVKDFYGYGMVSIVSTLVAELKNVKFESIKEDRDIVQPTFSRPDPVRRGVVLVHLPISTLSYAYDVPGTFAILATLYPFIKRRKRAYLEASLFLISIHFVYLFLKEAHELSAQLSRAGLETFSAQKRFIYELVWSLASSLTLGFESFLIGAYTFLRFRR